MIGKETGEDLDRAVQAIGLGTRTVSIGTWAENALNVVPERDGSWRTCWRQRGDELLESNGLRGGVRRGGSGGSHPAAHRTRERKLASWVQ